MSGAWWCCIGAVEGVATIASGSGSLLTFVEGIVERIPSHTFGTCL